MTSSKNTNSHNRLYNNENSNDDDSFSQNFNDDWSQFVSEHKKDFNDLEKSKSAKIFRKRINQAAEPLRNIAFSTKPGPRDNTTSSWLDVDKTMDEYGDDFVAPNPHFKNVSITLIGFMERVCFGRSRHDFERSSAIFCDLHWLC